MADEGSTTSMREMVGPVLVVELPMSTLDATTGAAFCDEVEPYLEEEAQVVFDLHRVQLVDSAGVSSLLACLKHLVAVGGDLKLCALTPQVGATLDLARIPRIVEIYDTREDAVRSYA